MSKIPSINEMAQNKDKNGKYDFYSTAKGK